MKLPINKSTTVSRAMLAPQDYIKTGFNSRHPFVVPIITFFILIIMSFIIFLFAGGQTVEGGDVKRVQVYVDGNTKTLPTHAKTVGELLKRLGINITKEDVVEPNINSPILSDDFHINVYRAKLVTIIDEDGRKIITKIAESSPAAIARKAGLRVYVEDRVEFSDPSEALRVGVIGDLILIKRSTQASINLYGKKISVRTHAKTVGDLLIEKNIKNINGDNVLPSLNTEITDNIAIFVVPAGKTVEIAEEKIEPETKTEYDATLDASEVKIIEPGRAGKRVVVYELKLDGKKVISRTEIQSLVSVQPITRVVIRGTKTAGFEGGFASALATLRGCEGSYSSNTGNGYYGAYQFALGTWQSNAPSGYKDVLPSDAPSQIQDQAASTLYQRSGWTPWPGCSRSLGLQDIYR